MGVGKFLLLLIFLLILFIPSVNALTVFPNSVVTGCPFTLSEKLWFDVCASPVTDATVFYNISSGVVDPTTLAYNSAQTLTNAGVGGTYTKDLAAGIVQGTYTASVKIIRTNFPTEYDSQTFDIIADYPYSTQFSYSGDLNYFNINWQGKYQGGSCSADRELAVQCFLNDRNDKPSIPNPTTALPEEVKTSTIPNAGTLYNLTKDMASTRGSSVNNLISCKFYDPANTNLLSWTNKTFRAVDFELIFPPITVSVGQPIDIPMHVRNFGLLTDNYTVNVTSNGPLPNLINVYNGNTRLTDVSSGETGDTHVRLTALAATPGLSINVNITSEVSGISFNENINIESNTINMAEFDIIGFIQVLLIATSILILVRFKKSSS